MTFGKNLTEWTALSTRQMDYWITAGDTPAEIEEAYADATGKVPMMPDYGCGFWQCKLRYQTQEELLEVAREYKRRGCQSLSLWPIISTGLIRGTGNSTRITGRI